MIDNSGRKEILNVQDGQHQFQFIIFKDENKLKGHFYKHFIDNYEWNKAWRLFNTGYKKEDMQLIDYITSVEIVLKEALNVPRYVIYYSKQHNTNCIVAFSESWIEIIGSLLDNNIYNISSAYVHKERYPGQKFRDCLSDLVKEVQSESIGKPIWFNFETWRIQDLNEINKTINTQKKKNRIRYDRSKEKKLWKRALNNYFEVNTDE